MSEIITALPSEISSSGQIQIADEVIANIASTAVLEAEGVAGMPGHFTGDIVARLGRKRHAKGVSLQINDGKVQISIEVLVNSGVKIQDVAKDVQQKVKTAIETMTGFVAEKINVRVTGLVA